jgi:hypothetical protein
MIHLKKKFNNGDNGDSIKCECLIYVFRNTFLLCIIDLTLMQNKYGKMLSIGGVCKQLLFIQCTFLVVCDAIQNLFNMLIKLYHLVISLIVIHNIVHILTNN